MLRTEMTYANTVLRLARVAAAPVALVAALSAFGPAAARTDAPKVESSKNWSVHAPKNTPIRTCFASTAPIDTKSSKSGIKRGKAFLIVATFPEQGVKAQVAVTLGFPANAKKAITLKVDNKTYKMFADGEEAWLDSPEDDAAAVAAMRAGAKAWVTATSTRGTKITDEYSLVGFTKAEKRSRELCG